MQAAVGSHCLDCAKASRPDVKTRAVFWNARQPALVTMVIIGLNVIAFLATVVQNSEALAGRVTRAHLEYDLFGPSVAVNDEWYRLVTSGFMHFGIIHIGFNMYLLYMLGQMLEPALGRVKFLLVYLAGLLGGSAGALLIEPNALSAGASGAVFGLMGLAFVGYYLNGMNPMNTSIGSLLIMNLFITFLIPRISIGGHIGGAAAGALCALTVMAPRHRQLPKWASYAGPTAVCAIAVVVSLAAANASV
ncbi:MAG TPA: rhomboid family intramembrane serine protease [Ilumatobacter sp.]|nr:rhomboid family intramembrane serine protease [Ilumatobacter sp.]